MTTDAEDPEIVKARSDELQRLTGDQARAIMDQEDAQEALAWMTSTVEQYPFAADWLGLERRHNSTFVDFGQVSFTGGLCYWNFGSPTGSPAESGGVSNDYSLYKSAFKLAFGQWLASEYPRLKKDHDSSVEFSAKMEKLISENQIRHEEEARNRFAIKVLIFLVLSFVLIVWIKGCVDGA